MTIITTIPYTISSPGYYELGSNISSTNSNFSAITINSDNVTLDLKNYTLSNSGAGPNTISNGVYANQRKNVTIQNGAVSNFLYGIRLEDTSTNYSVSNYLVKNVKTLSNTFRGMCISGTNNSVTCCIVDDTQGCTFFSNAFSCGIEVKGVCNYVARNVISTVFPQGTGEGLGISVSDGGNGSLIEDNKIINATLASSSYGIWVGGNSNVVCNNNTIINYQHGIAYSSPTSGAYLNNKAISCTVPYTISNSDVIDLGSNI